MRDGSEDGQIGRKKLFRDDENVLKLDFSDGCTTV